MFLVTNENMGLCLYIHISLSLSLYLSLSLFSLSLSNTQRFIFSLHKSKRKKHCRWLINAVWSKKCNLLWFMSMQVLFRQQLWPLFLSENKPDANSKVNLLNIGTCNFLVEDLEITFFFNLIIYINL